MQFRSLQQKEKNKMRENNNKLFQETEAAFAVAFMLLNTSILVALFTVGWLLYGLVAQFDYFAYFLQIA